MKRGSIGRINYGGMQANKVCHKHMRDSVAWRFCENQPDCFIHRKIARQGHGLLLFWASRSSSSPHPRHSCYRHRGGWSQGRTFATDNRLCRLGQRQSSKAAGKFHNMLFYENWGSRGSPSPFSTSPRWWLAMVYFHHPGSPRNNPAASVNFDGRRLSKFCLLLLILMLLFLAAWKQFVETSNLADSFSNQYLTDSIFLSVAIDLRTQN